MAWFGIVCSSWVSCNRGTSQRSVLLPQGDTSREYIKLPNCMTRGGTYFVEQPGSSILWYYPRLYSLEMVSKVLSLKIPARFMGLVVVVWGFSVWHCQAS